MVKKVLTRVISAVFGIVASVMLSAQANAQAVVVKGKVLDSGNEPVVGAFVMERGTQNGTSTDIDGTFVLSVKKNTVLDVSCIGYVTEAVTVGGGGYF